MIPPVVRGQTQRMMDCHFKILDIHFGWKKPHFIPIYKGFLLKMGAGYYLFRVSFHNFHFSYFILGGEATWSLFFFVLNN